MLKENKHNYKNDKKNKLKLQLLGAKITKIKRAKLILDGRNNFFSIHSTYF